jgi:hypothetical protein
MFSLFNLRHQRNADHAAWFPRGLSPAWKTEAISAIQLLLNQFMHHTVELLESRSVRVRSVALAAGSLLFVNHVGDL